MTRIEASRWIRLASLGQLLLVSLLLCASYANAQQSQDVTNAGLNFRIEDNMRRLQELEKQDASARLRVLENDMAEVKWLGRSVALAVIGQLVIAGLGVKRRSER